MSSKACKATGFGIALLLAGHASAFEMGQPSGRAVLGQSLRIEIPLSGVEGPPPASSCFRLRQPQIDVGNDFVARSGRVEVVSERGRIKLLVTTAMPLREPVIGFVVAAGCEFGLSREYTLLVGLPAAVEAPRIEPPAAPARTQAAEPARSIAATAAPADGELTLRQMAREKYPTQPRARERYMRMMLKANPELGGRDEPIAAGTELQSPPGLPERRTAQQRPAAETAAEAPPRQPAKRARRAAEAEPPAPPPPPAPQARQRPAGKGSDRLVLGAAPESKESVLLAEAERLANVLIEQNKQQEELVANVAKLEASYNQLREELITVQAQLAHAEQERIEAKKAADYSRFAKTLDLVVAVLGGGALGGILLRLLERRRSESATLDAEVKAI